ncbi:KN motif and ankyrin repeat domain-containing protein 2 isoform X2 [Drosophila elegans]|uniref:KN motif and ankyrin repeat domain-containing protein 2 isoform X2 n=1 Tax=Drosophila elegans TaxID=30023 RepID=UPI0007E5F154|nr:KN motif and ankyrin repeat domain-containing protein 2 isoform X2 [Drosophila elegans]
MLWNLFWIGVLWLWHEAKIPQETRPGSSTANPAPSGMSRSVRSCNCCPYGYHIDLDFVRYCEALAHEKPSEDEQRRRDRRRSRKSMEFMLGFESLFGGDWQAESRVQGKLSEASHESEPDSPRPIGGTVCGMSQSYSTTPCYRPRSSSVPRFTYGSIPPRSESPFGTASSTCSSLRGGVESDVGAGSGALSGNYYQQRHHPAISPPETRAFLHEALDEVCSDFERTLERTSVKKRKTPYGGSLSMDRNNNKLSLSHTNGHGPLATEHKSHRLGNSTWDRYFDVADSCIGGNRSPTGTPRPFLRSNTLPLQQRPSPAEVQYESYVQATVAANAKSPVEQLESPKSPGVAPPPPPRRHHLLATTPTGTPNSKEDRQQENGSMSSSSLQSPVISEAGQANADAQALFQIREQMALSLRRLKDLEEQVKVIPDMELELNSLRSEKQKLLRRNEELMRSQRQTPSPPSPGLKTASPVQFTPQRISPVSLESLGARMRSSSTSASPSPSVVRRDVSTQAVVRPPATRDVSVGHQPSTRNVGVQPSETVYSKDELEQKVEQALSNAHRQQLRKLISVGTQMYVPQREQRDSGVQTQPERPKLKYNVGVTAKPATRDNFTSCKPDVRHVASSEDRLDDVLCEKCAVSKKNVACGPETPPEKVKPAPQMPGRSNTFSLGENETVSVVRKTQGCQTPVTLVHSAGSQTTTAVVRSTGAQVNPQQQHSAVQCGTELVNRQTDTIGLQRLSRSPMKAEQVAEPMPRPQTRHTGSNTDKEKEPEAVKVRTSHSACNTEEVRKRDVGCGDIVKPHISIACAANYCDSCKEAIQDLARGFSKSSPTAPRTGGAGRRSTSADSRIPRPKHLTSPSPVRKEFKRQNTYTLATPSPTPSPQLERKARLSSLQEKPPVVSSFQAADPLGESQSFIKQPQKDLLDLSLLGDDELIVREEKRVSISWSRDASPAPLMTSSGTTKSESPEQEPAMSSSSDSSPPIDVQIAQGARKKSSTPLKSSQSEGSQVTVIEKPATKAQLHQLAQAESEPRKKTELSKGLQDALKVINDSLLKKLGAKPISSQSLKSAKATIQDHWFINSSTGKSDPHQVEDYLDYFESLSVPLLEYCVNLSDSNGNTAMHYAVSHGNFDVVSILLDSKVCDVNQMNNAGYTSVMLVSLAKLKQPSHRTVVERLFKMADVNIRAKKHCQTALMLAVSHGNGDMVNMLLDAGADINIQDEDGSTALMCAAEHGRVDVIKTLLSNPECDSLVNDVDGSTAFKIAWQAGHRDVGLLIYVHEQMLRSKMPHRGEPTRSSLISPQRHKRQPSQ